MGAKALSDSIKAKVIEQIMIQIKIAAFTSEKTFDESVFFSLAFRSDRELKSIAKRCGVKIPRK